MTSQTSAQILSHPRWGHFIEPGSDDELIFGSRMVWVHIINKAILGVVTLSDRDKDMIRMLNGLLIKYGWEPLHPDFENL